MNTILFALALLLPVLASADDRAVYFAHISDSSVADGETKSPCGRDGQTLESEGCLAMKDITILAVGVATVANLNAATECGRVTLEVDDVNQDVFSVAFGSGNIPTLGHCALNNDGVFDMDRTDESCVRRNAVDVDAGQFYNWVWLNMATTPPSPCNSTLTDFRGGIVSMEEVKR